MAMFILKRSDSCGAWNLMAKVLFPVEEEVEDGSRSDNMSSKQPSMKSFGASGGDHGALKFSSPGIGKMIEPVDDDDLS